MNEVLAKTGAVSFLNAMLNDVWPSGGKDLTLHLYTNNPDVDEDDTASVFTEPVLYDAGYEPITIATGADLWTLTAGESVIPFGGTTAQKDDVVFSFSGELTAGASVYGYFILDADGDLMWSGKLHSPFTPSLSSLTLSFTPKLQLAWETYGTYPGYSKGIYATSDFAYSLFRTRLNNETSNSLYFHIDGSYDIPFEWGWTDPLELESGDWAIVTTPQVLATYNSATVPIEFTVPASPTPPAGCYIENVRIYQSIESSDRTLIGSIYDAFSTRYYPLVVGDKVVINMTVGIKAGVPTPIT